MNARFITAVTFCLTLASTLVGLAEEPGRRQPVRRANARWVTQTSDNYAPPPLPQTALPAPPAVESGPDYLWASTVAQGYLDGLARLVRAEGIATYDMALAAISLEIARDAALRNELTAQGVRQALRLRERDYRRVLRGPPITHEQATRIAHKRAPKRLAVEQIDYSRGRINWPVALRARRFADDRQRIEEALVGYASYDSQSPSCEKVQTVIERMTAQLIAQQKSLPPKSYLNARNFLKGLECEVRLGG